jgi:hypothetical protein
MIEKCYIANNRSERRSECKCRLSPRNVGIKGRALCGPEQGVII